MSSRAETEMSRKNLLPLLLSLAFMRCYLTWCAVLQDPVYFHFISIRTVNFTKLIEIHTCICLMCTINVNTAHNIPDLWITNNLTSSFRDASWIVKHFYPKLQAATLIFALTYWIWYRRSRCVFNCFFL